MTFFDDRTDQIIYVGDPMCSWCWGISPQLRQIKDYYKDILPFTIVAGGLRPGGGEPWNDEMKKFLKHHWREVHHMSGQPFGYKLFDFDDFNYDTEPACRSVVVARNYLQDQLLDFFEAIQFNFYVKSMDPGQESFYRPLCEQFGISYEEFINSFRSEQIKKQTYAEFQLNRQWGVRGYPTLLLNKNSHLYLISNGYSDFDSMKGDIEYFLENKEYTQ